MKIAFIFPGQGSQAIGMGKDLYSQAPKARSLLEEASDALSYDMKTLLFEPNDLLEQTEFTQPAIFTVSAMALEVFKQGCSLFPSFALGHSLGELTALYAAKAISFEKGVRLVNKRGKLMREACQNLEVGMMAVLGLEDEKVEALCASSLEKGGRVWPANYNSPGQVVIAGVRQDLVALESTMKEAGAKRVLILNMSIASHCPLLLPACKPLIENLNEDVDKYFDFPIVSNVTAKAYKSKDEAVKLLGEQLIKPVLYKQSIEANDEDIEIYIEFGGSVLKGLNRRISKKPTYCITDMSSLEETLKLMQ